MTYYRIGDYLLSVGRNLNCIVRSRIESNVVSCCLRESARDVNLWVSPSMALLLGTLIEL